MFVRISSFFFFFYENPSGGKPAVSRGRTGMRTLVVAFRYCVGNEPKICPFLASASAKKKSEEVLIFAGGAVQVGY